MIVQFKTKKKRFQGLIEPEKELAKLEKKRQALTQTISKLEKDMSREDYESKVPEEIRNSNAAKLKEALGEIDRLAAAMASLAAMS